MYVVDSCLITCTVVIGRDTCVRDGATLVPVLVRHRPTATAMTH